jgi:hypothetical protein
MDLRGLWRLGRLLLLIAALAVGTAGLAGSWSSSDTSVALASVAADQNDNDEDQNNDNDDEANRELEGQVVSPGGGFPGINRDARPDLGRPYPEMYVANVDGIVVVRVVRPEQLDISGVREGDHVSVDGVKINAFLFDAYNIEVTERGGGPPARDSATSDDNANDNDDDSDEDDDDEEDNENANDDNDND